MAIATISTVPGAATIVPTAPAALALAPGQVLEAQVLQALGAGAVRISLGDVIIDAVTQTGLQPGARLTVRVEGAGEQLRLAVVGAEKAPRGTAAANSPTQAASRPAVASPSVSLPQTASTAAPEVARAAAAQTLAAQQAGSDAPRPAGPITSGPGANAQNFAPPAERLFADLARAAAGGNTGAVEPLRQAAARLLELTVPAQREPVAARPLPSNSPAATLLGDLARVVAAERGQVPEVARVAAARILGLEIPARATGATAPVSTSGAQPATADPTAAIASVFRAAAKVLAEPAQAVPAAVRNAAANLLATRLPDAANLSGDALQKAVATSGLFYEAGLAQGTGGKPPAGDLKLALFILRDAVRVWTGEADQAARPDKANAAPANRQGQPAPTPGQAEAADARVRDLARVLQAQTDAALSRLRVAQVAAMPDRVDQPVAQQGEPGQVFNLVLPLANGDKTGFLELQIERDGANKGEGRDGEGWRVRFSLEVEPVGPAQAVVALRGGEVSVNLWAERRETADLFLANVALLRGMLETAELTPGILAVRRGRPPARAWRGARLLDRRS